MDPGAKHDVGVMGLGVMGANLALNIESRGFSVAVYNRTWSRTEAFIREFASDKGLAAYRTLTEFVHALSPPRRVVLMVQAGAPVDGVITDLVPLLREDDIIVDAGNSLFTDTARREVECESRGLRYVGMGVSGGEEGALRGPSLMPGGGAMAYQALEPILSRIAAKTEDGPCVTHVGRGGAGHFVKMVHNGIEYGDMQLIAEVYDLMRTGFGLETERLRAVFEEWDHTELRSYLIEITADILGATDPDDGDLILDRIVDSAGHKGTGRWTVRTALDLSTPVPTISAAVDARFLSAMREARASAVRILGDSSHGVRAPGPEALEDVAAALYASKVCSYAQGMALLRAGDAQYDFGLNLSEIARIWKGGCIIRAEVLDAIRNAYVRDPELSNLILDAGFSNALRSREPAWRRTVTRAAELGLPVPAMAASLAYYDSLRRERSPASLIQAQRDYFGAHTYQRLDEEGAFHTDWAGSKRTTRVS